MKHFLSLSLVFLFFNLSAQSKWSVGLIGGVDVSNIQSDETFRITDVNGRPIAVAEASLQFRYGVNVDYQLGAKLFWKAGFRINGQGNQASFDMGDPNNELVLKDRRTFLERYLSIFRMYTVKANGTGMWKEGFHQIYIYRVPLSV